MKPAKLSSNVFLELPPVLAHYIDSDRNLWLEGNPKRGRLSILNRSGAFLDLESLAIERRNLIRIIGKDRVRALKYQTGFEVGRRDGQRHYELHSENGRLALQAGLVYGQVQGNYIAEDKKFEFDIESGTLYREIELQSCVEAVVHRMTVPDAEECVCWNTAGYISGHISELVERKVITVETECVAHGAEACRFVSKLDSEWGEEADWIREAEAMGSLEDELAQRDELIENAQQAARKAQASLGGINRRLRSDLAADSLIAESKAMQPALKRMQLCMTSKAPVLITGEAGVGKESVARSIHFGSDRKRRPFIEIDCKGMPDTIIKQELLGYDKGSIPGSLKAHRGAFDKAQGGTIYFNEIAELGGELQGILLRFLEDGRVQPIGATTGSKMNVRIVCATQTDPDKAVKSGKIREDLFYALSVSRVDVPPLRKRESDILRLAEAFLVEFRERHNCEHVDMSQEFKEALIGSAWPGNVRQLRNVVEHSVIMSTDGTLTPKELPQEILASRWVKKPEVLTEEVILAMLNRTHNNRSEAADLLGIGRTTLWRAMKKHGID
jgi:DNA-binding NtrC family response regulator/predicted hydrocarbon binding protein